VIIVGRLYTLGMAEKPKRTYVASCPTGTRVTKYVDTFCRLMAADPTRDVALTYRIAHPLCKVKNPELSARSLLAQQNVKDLIAYYLRPAAERLGVDTEYVLLGLMEVLEKALREKEVERYDPVSKKKMGIGEFVFDSSGANRALELMGRHVRMFTDNVDVTTRGQPVQQPVYAILDPSWKVKIDEFTNRLRSDGGGT